MMLKIHWSESFIRKTKKIIKNDPQFRNKLYKRTELFSKDQFDPLLKTHKLKGKLKDLWAFSIDYNYRFVFKDNSVVFLNIGDHDEVY